MVPLPPHTFPRSSFCSFFLLPLLYPALTLLHHFLDFAQHHIDSLDLTVHSVAFLAKLFPGKTDQEYRQHLGAFGITVLFLLSPFPALFSVLTLMLSLLPLSRPGNDFPSTHWHSLRRTEVPSSVCNPFPTEAAHSFIRRAY